MRIERLTLRGVMCFADLTLDTRSLPEGLIAIVGENGAGKTTLLESPIAALFRQFPSRDHELFDYATARDSSLALTVAVEGRGVYEARVNLDPVRRTSDAVLIQTNADGTPTVLNDGKVSTYDDVIRREFPSKELLLASCFAAQNKRGSFIGKKPKERKELFADLLGLNAYAAMSQTARTITGFIEQAREKLRVLRDELARETDAALLATLNREHGAHTDAKAAAVARQRDLQAEIAMLERRLGVMQDAVAAYAASQQRLVTLDREVTTRRAELAGVIRDVERIATETDSEVDRMANAAQRQVAEVEALIANNKVLLASADQVRSAVAANTADQAVIEAERLKLRPLQDQLTAFRNDEMKTRDSITRLHKQQTLLKVVEDSVAILDKVPCGGAGEHASCQFLKNAKAGATQIPSLRDEVEQLETAKLALSSIQDSIASVTGDIGRIDHTITAAHQRIASRAADAALAEKLAVAEARIEELQIRRTQILDTAETQKAEARHSAIARANELRDRGEALGDTIAQLEQERETAQRDLEDTSTRHQEATALQAQLTQARSDLTAAAVAEAQAAQALKDNADRRWAFHHKARRQAAIETRITALETDLLEWQTLAKALGHGGLPDLEIDAAGPTISSYTNDLLGVAYGTRFSVELVTQRVKADGKGVKDEFTVQVTDNAHGGEVRDISDLSGGEQVIVSEALMNAIAVYVNTRSPMPVRTAWRDETTGALDPEHAVRYVQMLRKVHELAGLHHTFFITHNHDVAALADAQIRVAHGAIEMMSPPFSAAA